MINDQFSAYETADEISQKIAEINGLISLQLDEILHHPDFKALEATWRGLLYLVSQTDSDLKVKILMLNAGKKDLLKDFDRAMEFDESQIFEKVFTDIFTSPRGMPFGMLIGALAVIEHRLAKKHCPACGSLATGRFPVCTLSVMQRIFNFHYEGGT